MPPYKSFFYGAFFFLFGVFCASYDVGWAVPIGALVLLFLGLFFSRLLRAREFLYAGLLSLFALAGAFYYNWQAAYSFPDAMVFDAPVTIEGYVANDPSVAGGSVRAYIAIEAPFEGAVLATVRRFPELSYGTRVSLEGTIERPQPEGYRNYLAKESLYGTMRYPEVSMLEGAGGSKIKKALFSIKHTALNVFGRVLPAESAAFLGGITLGARSEFSESFTNAMSLSGTTHLVALSGYNISVLEWALLGMLTFLMRKRAAYIALAVCIFGFVVMTGAEASVVRAAIMGTLVLFASEMGRVADTRNVLLFVALIMVVANPKVLVFDVGFELSFLALIGIVYLKPAIISFLKLGREKGFLSWRDNLITTTAAQLMTLPLIVAQFGSFSAFSLLANVLILELVPVTMGLGFLLAAAGAVSYHLSLALGWITNVLLACETGIIRFFGEVALPLRFAAGPLFVACYYGLLLAFMVYALKKVAKNSAL